MSNYPNSIDSDTELPRVDDNLTDIGSEAINSLRDAVFNIEESLGLMPQGSLSSLSDRVNVSINANGTIKAAALTAVGLVTLPIDNNDVGASAGIVESKLALDYSTSSLFTMISGNSTIIGGLTTAYNGLAADFASHVSGGSFRHNANNINIDFPLNDKTGIPYPGVVNLEQGLLAINNSLNTHLNSNLNAHPATAINVDTSNFNEIPTTATTVQAALEAIDQSELLTMGAHRNTMHSNGIPQDSRSNAFSSHIGADGYNLNVVPPTRVYTYVAHYPPGTGPVNDPTTGDNVVEFVPANNADFSFDSLFSQVRVGDHITINYGYGFEMISIIESIRYVPGTSWVIRVSNTNLLDVDSNSEGFAYARIDRPLADTNIYGILAVAAANILPETTFGQPLSSLIIGDPKGAMALGINFNSNEIDETHYMLYLQVYPTGNPTQRVISLPGIDVTGNQGKTPGRYTLANVVQTTNNAFRSAGFNYRFIAFENNGNFGIMLADTYGSAAFSIVSGANVGGSLTVGSYVNNIIGNALASNFDAFGFGWGRADCASPAYPVTFSDSFAALLPTKIISPLRNRSYNVNGVRYDYLAAARNTVNGFWEAEITARTVVGSTVKTTYEINGYDLRNSGLMSGKTLVVQPAIEFSDPLYNDVDYGRFFIESVTFDDCFCAPDTPNKVLITVFNSIHAFGNPVRASGGPGLNVKIYFSNDSVGFNDTNLVNPSNISNQFHKLFEVYVDDKAQTFSHERGRMPNQSEGSNNLGTANFEITDISPKLKGYKDDASTDLNRYVRFMVLSYNPISGEYTGYIGKKLGATGIERFGVITTARKNIPARFYDETNVDYIEIVFNEPSTSNPGVAILSTNSQRFVDIEVFPSLQFDDEVMLLATCQVNWRPESGYSVVSNVKDKRQIGSISEKEFTNSAIDFIRAGDRHLHANGVLRGLNIRSYATPDLRVVNLNGGVALVDGAIVAVNNGSVVIPQVFDSTGTLPQTLEWAVCVNKFGNFVPVLLTGTKEQIFATGQISSNTYYIDSCTSSELLNRKDLTILHIVTVTINSITLNGHSDVRRFVDSQTGDIPLVVSSSGTTGSFHTFQAAVAWMRSFGSDNAIIYVKGEIDINASINITSNYSINFIGQNAKINFTGNGSFVLGNNISFENIEFNYNVNIPSAAFTSDSINADGGCILVNSLNENKENIKIINCRFNSTSAKRRPFILFRAHANGRYIKNIIIKNNIFNDNYTGSIDPLALLQSRSYAAIAFVNTNTGGSISTTLSDVFIEENICQQTQGIYVTSLSVNNIPGLNAINVNISKNRCNTIGVMSSANDSFSDNINIENNTAFFIGSLGGNGKAISGNILYASGNVSVLLNKTVYIKFLNSSMALYKSNITIKNNKLIYDDNLLLQTYFNYIMSNSGRSAISILGTSTDEHENLCNIEGNDIFSISNTLYYPYYVYIQNCSTNIINNSFNKIVESGLFVGSVNSVKNQYLVQFNRFNRFNQSVPVLGYISSNSDSNDYGIISGNVFDSYQLSTKLNTISESFSKAFIIKNNKNQVAKKYLDARDGIVGITENPSNDHNYSIISSGSESEATSNYNVTFYNTIAGTKYSVMDHRDNIRLRYVTGGGSGPRVNLSFNLNGLIPENSKLYTFRFLTASSATVDANIIMNYNKTIGISGTPIVDVISSNIVSFDGSYVPDSVIERIIDIDSKNYYIDSNNSIDNIRILINSTGAGATCNIFASRIEVTYIY